MEQITAQKKETPYTPEQAGYDGSRLVTLDRHYQQLIADQKLQCGGYMMARDGKIFAHSATGRKDFRDETPVSPDDIFRIASITKAFTAVAVMKLVEDGLIRLEQQVSSIIEEFDTNTHRHISIFHLLTHSSGMGFEMVEGSPYAEDYEARYQRFDNNWLKVGLSFPMTYPAGTEWSYCNFGFKVLGEVIGRISGMKAEEYIEKNILEPLGMTDSGFAVPKEKWSRLIVPNEWSIPRERQQEHYEPRTVGGLYSTMNDLVIFGQMLLNKGEWNGVRILGRKTVEDMTYPHLENCNDHCWDRNYTDVKYGLGLHLEYKRTTGNTGLSVGTFGHGGAGRSQLSVDPAERFVVVFISFTDIDWLPESMLNTQTVIWSGLK